MTWIVNLSYTLPESNNKSLRPNTYDQKCMYFSSKFLWFHFIKLFFRFTCSLEKVIKTKIALSHLNRALMTECCYLGLKQIDCLNNILNSNIIAIFPTGYGKSLIFEILPFFSYHLCNKKAVVLLIAPLNVLIEQEYTS